MGHTCSASAILDGEAVTKLKIEWVPAVIVPRVSDRGDEVFDAIHQPVDDLHPLEAGWLGRGSSAGPHRGAGTDCGCVPGVDSTRKSAHSEPADRVPGSSEKAH